MIAAAECGATVFRNNRGMFLTLDGKRKIRAGLEAAGSADLIGFTHDGRYLAIECKTDKGRPSPEQVKFLSLVNAAGGLGFIARSAEDVKKELTNSL
jgi:hypothetical protein